ncbi:hypothetical protein [Methylobacterium phyllosphaerae]|nr:hypothetical protein [Methylobacterium phyllosphaerae]
MDAGSRLETERKASDLAQRAAASEVLVTYRMLPTSNGPTSRPLTGSHTILTAVRIRLSPSNSLIDLQPGR